MIPFLGEAFQELTSVNRIRIDNAIFRLNYILLASTLFGASGVLLTTQMFGDPIDCLSDGSTQKPDSVQATIDKFCWVGATYTIPELHPHKYNTGITRHGIIYDGVGQFNLSAGHTKSHFIYYRWIFFLFFVQGLFLYFPHYLWKYWENGRMQALAGPFDSPYDSVDDAVVETLAILYDPEARKNGVSKRINQITDSFAAYDVNRYCRYAFKLVVCEFLNLVMVIGTFLLTDMVLENRFAGAGLEIMKLGLTETTILDKMFPTHAKCLWKDVGPSGTPQNHDALCVLPLNTFNRFIFKCLWFLLVSMMVINSLVIVYRFVTWLSKWLRTILMKIKVGCYVVKDSHPHPQLAICSQCIDDICEIFPYGDWYVLYELTDNVDKIEYQNILLALREKLSEKNNSLRQTRRSTVPDVTCVFNFTNPKDSN